MAASAPLLSVVIVCRNPGPRLKEALASVWDQAAATCEIVVIDGASTDGTREWLEAQRDRLGHLVSEPDSGIYDAMNKGVAAARGDWLLFLGADDRLEPGALSALALVLQSASAGVVAGEAAFDDGRVYALGQPAMAARRNFVHHQAACYRRVLFDTHGAFDPTLRVMADYDLNLRLLHAGVGFAAAPVRVASCTSGGLSDSGAWIGYREEIVVRRRHFPFATTWLWDLGSVVRFVRKQFVRARSSHG